MKRLVLVSIIGTLLVGLCFSCSDEEKLSDNRAGYGDTYNTRNHYNDDDEGFFGSIWESTKRTWKGGWFDKAIVIGIIVFIIALVFLLCIGLFVAFDSWFLPIQKAPGVVIGKDYTPPSMTPITSTVNNVSTTTYIQNPEVHSLCIHVGDESGWLSVCHDFYHEVSDGTKVTAGYVRGRYSKEMYLKQVWG